MKIDSSFLDSLISVARETLRLRKHYDLRDTSEDDSMRMLNALEPGTIIPIHRHKSTSENVICIKGCVEEIIYDKDGIEIERYRLEPNSDCMMCVVPMNVYHTCVSLVSGSVIVEFKNGRYDPNTTEDFLIK